jgi:predicted exporter
VARAAAGLWALVMGAVLGHCLWLARGGLQVETNLLALLPPSAELQAAAQLTDAAAKRGQQEVVVLLSAPTLAEAEAAAESAEQRLPLQWESPSANADQLTNPLAPHRAALLDDEQLASLQVSDDRLGARAWAALTQPLGLRIGKLADDPLGLFSETLARRATLSRLAPRGHFWELPLASTPTLALRGRVRGEAFSLSGAEPLANAFAALRQSVPSIVEMHIAGVPLFAEAAAAQAAAEVSTVGVGSLIGIVLLMWLAFRSVRPLVWVVASVALGVASGLSATTLVFGKVHVMTLVFGASLVGVAEDYAIHWFVSRQQSPHEVPRALLRRLLPGLALAMGTSVAGYAVLGAAPFPSLRQVAFFSAVGLASAFITVAVWFPSLASHPVAPTALATRWTQARRWWPQLSTRPLLVGSIGIALFALWSLTRLEARDDVRGLQSAPPELVREQRYVAEALGLPGPAQFFLINGSDETEVLSREETLRQQLGLLERDGVITGHVAVSQWVPSAPRQRRSQSAFVHARDVALAVLADQLNDVTPSPLPAAPLRVSDLKDTPLWAALGPLWGDTQSLVLLSGVTPDALPALKAVDTPGTRLIDRTDAISQRLRRWRELMQWLLGPALVIVAMALAWRFGVSSWRPLVPVMLGGLVALSMVSAIGESLTLFHVLALYVLLGVGVDYGIFLLEHPEGGEAWLAVGLGAVSTLLSFGLLAVSRTPAIHAFGLTLGVGVAFVWLVAPLFAKAKGFTKLQ